MQNVSIVIVNWNGRRYIEKCLKGLEKQHYRHFTTVLVDNGSTDNSVGFVKSNYPEVILIELPENTGFSIGNNIYLKNVSTQYVALLNNDAVPHPFWLENLVSALEKHPQAGFAASKMLYYHEPHRIDRAGDAYTRAGTALLRGRGQPSESFNEVEYVFGACAGAAIYRTEMLRDIGLFDEDLFLLYEDVDLSFRAQLKGYRCIYVPDAIVYHVGSHSIGTDSPVSVYYSHRNLEWIYLKNMPRKLILKSIFPHLVYDFASLLFFMVRGKGYIFVKAKIDALRNLKRVLYKRRKIQSQKTVSDAYIWNLLERETYFQRITRRLKNSPASLTSF